MCVISPDFTLYTGLYPYRRLQYNKAAKDLKVGQGWGITWFLAEGSSYHQHAYEFFHGVSTIAQIIPETCEVTWSALQPHFMCHYGHSGSNNFNYLHYFSAVLMTSADADSLFVTIDVGAPGRNSDGGVSRASRLGLWLATDSLNIPATAPLPGDETGTPFPYYFCADEAFPLRENIMRSSACVLHTFTRIRDGSTSIPDNFEYQKPHVTCTDDDRTGPAKGCHWREILANYFVHVSAIPYQWDHVVWEPAEGTDAD
ncbi:hypothetical protein PR048_019127 [Dryococelus australis]|uniref:DDE Tnp4 domain-containing protein n=1 Tax=Dryococelus australis TaxID=614101 RepID=A0ABQ9H2L9_9NEOP|nr:hypothetical protein PR048_019127 [Dryococelus australis]